MAHSTNPVDGQRCRHHYSVALQIGSATSPEADALQPLSLYS